MELINKTVLDQLKAGKKYTATKTITENIDVNITLSPQEQETVRIEAWLMQKSPKQKISEIGKKNIVSRNYNTLPVDVNNVCRSLLDSYVKLHAPIVVRNKSSKAFRDRVLSIPNIFDPSNYTPYTKRGWGETTTLQAVNYYACTIGDFYTEYGEDATITEFQKFKDDEAARIYKTQYNRPCADGNVVKKRREQIYNGLNIRFSQALIVQRFLLEHYPEMGWPQTPIPVSIHTVTTRDENIKTVDYEKYVKFVTLIVRCCEAQVPHAFAASGTAICAERMGESCAPLIGDFELREKIGRYYVGHQVDGKNQRTDILKNEDSYRYVVFGQLMIHLINLRKNQLFERGYSIEQIVMMPFGARNSDPYAFLSKSEVSTFVRRLLVLVGCDAQWLEQEAIKMYAAAEASGNADDVDIGAHELRSTLATFLGNGGMPPEMLDAYLGHQNENVKKDTYSSWEAAETIAHILERCLPYGSLCATDNPAQSPVTVGVPCSYQLAGNTAYRFHCETDMYVEIDLTTLECGDVLLVQLPAECETTALHRRTIPDTIEDRRTRPVLPHLPSEETIEQWIAEAREIDLSDIIKKYKGEISCT